MAGNEREEEFSLLYYVGHKRKFGHKFLQFEFCPDGKLYYANNSNHQNDTMIRKEVFLTPAVFRECRHIIADSEVNIASGMAVNAECKLILAVMPLHATIYSFESKYGTKYTSICLKPNRKIPLSIGDANLQKY